MPPTLPCMTTKHEHPHPGPVRIPRPRSVAEGKVAMALGGRTTACDWLPVGLSDELDALRVEQLRLRDKAADLAAERDELIRTYRVEDGEYERALRDAARRGVEAPEDKRTGPGIRAAGLEALEDNLWATLGALAEVAEEVVRTVRSQEEDLLAGAREAFAAAQMKRLEAERLVTEAKAEEWRAGQFGRWVQSVADAGPMSRQPFPKPGPAPPVMLDHVVEAGLHRHWSRPTPAEPTRGAATPETDGMVTITADGEVLTDEPETGNAA